MGQHRLTLADLHKVPVDVELSDQTGFPLQGTIEYVSPGIDPATGTLLVRGILANPDRTLLPGFFVNIRLPMGKVDRNALLVPDRALQEDQGGRYLLSSTRMMSSNSAMCSSVNWMDRCGSSPRA